MTWHESSDWVLSSDLKSLGKAPLKQKLQVFKVRKSDVLLTFSTVWHSWCLTDVWRMFDDGGTKSEKKWGKRHSFGLWRPVTFDSEELFPNFLDHWKALDLNFHVISWVGGVHLTLEREKLFSENIAKMVDFARKVKTRNRFHRLAAMLSAP